jgi:hypothetical protein
MTDDQITSADSLRLAYGWRVRQKMAAFFGNQKFATALAEFKNFHSTVCVMVFDALTEQRKASPSFPCTVATIDFLTEKAIATLEAAATPANPPVADGR